MVNHYLSGMTSMLALLSILLGQMKFWKNRLSSWSGYEWNLQVKVSPTQVREVMLHPVDIFSTCAKVVRRMSDSLVLPHDFRAYVHRMRGGIKVS